MTVALDLYKFVQSLCMLFSMIWERLISDLIIIIIIIIMFVLKLFFFCFSVYIYAYASQWEHMCLVKKKMTCLIRGGKTFLPFPSWKEEKH